MSRAVAAPERIGCLARGYGAICDAVALSSEIVIVVALGVGLAVSAANALVRFGFHGSIPWSDDVSLIVLNVVAFLGAPPMFRRDGGMAFTYFVGSTSAARRARIEAIALWAVILVTIAMLSSFPSYVSDAASRRFVSLPADETIVTVWYGIGLCSTIMYSIEKLLKLPSGPVIVGLVVAAAGGLGVALAAYLNSMAWIAIDPLLAGLILASIAFLCGVPIAYVVALGGMSALVISGAHVFVALAATMSNGVSSVVLVAVPFFLIAGGTLQVSGTAALLTDLFVAWFGHFRGGLLMVAVGAMYVFSGLSGSKAADIAAVGSTLREVYKRERYPPSEVVAVLAGSAAMGETVPPSIVMLVLASITSLSTGALFLAGITPALVLGIILIAAIAYRARGGRLPQGKPFELGKALRSIPRSVPALIVLVLILGGIAAGITTPTESATVAALYGLLLAVVMSRSVGAVAKVLRDAALVAGTVLFIVSAASVVAQAAVLNDLPTKLLMVFTHAGGKVGFIVASIIGLLVIGTVFEGLPGLLVFGPILLPLAHGFGIDPLQYGIVLILAMGIGISAPPFGVHLYITASVIKAEVHDAFRAAAFYTCILLLGLAVIASVPVITLWLPHLVATVAKR